MAYIPAACEAFQAPGVLLGWICCACGHFNPKKGKACRTCRHDCCSVIELAPVVRNLKKERKENHNARVTPVLQKRKPTSLRERVVIR